MVPTSQMLAVASYVLTQKLKGRKKYSHGDLGLLSAYRQSISSFPLLLAIATLCSPLKVVKRATIRRIAVLKNRLIGSQNKIQDSSHYSNDTDEAQHHTSSFYREVVGFGVRLREQKISMELSASYAAASNSTSPISL